MTDLTGRRFGRLQVLYPTENRDRHGTVCWICRCDCGREIEVSATSLAGGSCKSCGCLKKENQEKLTERLHRVDGTCVEFLEKRKHRKDNKSGFRGVFRMASGKYRVSIGFQGRRIHIGVFSNFEEAVEARQKAEEEIYGGFLREYRIWEEKAKSDPQWGRDHPFGNM